MLHLGRINFDLDFFLSYLLHPPPAIWDGLRVTISIAILAQAAACKSASDLTVATPM
jgi:hypothetical protein